jgi:adenosylcobyric acid synthase
MGQRILDPDGIESSLASLEGLSLLDVVTRFSRDKITVPVSGVHRVSGHPIEGYEIHMGQTVGEEQCAPVFEIRDWNGREPRPDGAMSADGRIFGTYVHGLFDAPLFRRWFLNTLRSARGWSALDSSQDASLDQRLDRLADFVATYLDMNRLDAIIDRSFAR